MARRLSDSPLSSKTSSESSDTEVRRSYERAGIPAREAVLAGKNGRGRASLEPLNESSPLLSPEEDEFQHGCLPPVPGTPSGMLDWGEEDEEESKSMWYLFVLTLSIGG